jgi:hypothetical protein
LGAAFQIFEHKAAIIFGQGFLQLDAVLVEQLHQGPGHKVVRYKFGDRTGNGVLVRRNLLDFAPLYGPVSKLDQSVVADLQNGQ